MTKQAGENKKSKFDIKLNIIKKRKGNRGEERLSKPIKHQIWAKEFVPKLARQTVMLYLKAVLTAVDMKQALQTKCKTCFEGPRMILDTL